MQCSPTPAFSGLPAAKGETEIRADATARFQDQTPKNPICNLNGFVHTKPANLICLLSRDLPYIFTPMIGSPLATVPFVAASEKLTPSFVCLPSLLSMLRPG